jgi:CubicO group peptidase (beta-lactamase class C family)
MMLLACWNAYARAEPVFTSELETNLNEYIDQVRSCRHIPGFTLSVVKANDTWAQGYGVADMTTGRTVDNQTLFGIGSLTKAFTSTLLAILLTDNDKGYVPITSEYPLYRP